MPATKAKRTLLVDCDTGVDDAIALLYLLADPGVEICGISTVFGNTSAAQAAQNTLAVLDVAGYTGKVPVTKGCEVPLTGGDPHLATHVQRRERPRRRGAGPTSRSPQRGQRP